MDVRTDPVASTPSLLSASRLSSGEDVSASSESPEARGHDHSLPLRIATAIVALPVLALLLKLGGLYFFALVAGLIVLGLREFYDLMSLQAMRPYRWLGLGTGVAVAWFVYAGMPTHASLFLTAFLLGTMALEMLRPRDHGVAPIAVTLFGVLYVGWLSAHLLFLREIPLREGLSYDRGIVFVALAVIPTWACDTIAYAVGRAFGRNRIHPAISPRKSVEGSAAGLVAALAAAVILKITVADFVGWAEIVILGLLIGVFALVGDLVESLIKRTSRAKDSSGVIPGHGGVLDRFDSLFFTAPLTYYFLILVVLKSAQP